MIHRDYLAHCLRWSHVVKFLNQGHKYKDAIVLDVGCGKEMPLAKTLYVNKMTPRSYVGVDANKFEIPEMLAGKKIPISAWSETDFCALTYQDVGVKILDENDSEGPGYNDFELPNVLVCFEVLEHVTPEHCRRMLLHFQELTSSDCEYFISTPCWNGSAAENHINEMTFGALGSLIEDLGFKIEGVFGTFASISDYKSELSAVTVYDKNTNKELSRTNLNDVFDALRNYYDTNVLSILFAPLFPAMSRNCLWHLSKRRFEKDSPENTDAMFTKLELQPTPWSQHPEWLKLCGYQHVHTEECWKGINGERVDANVICGRSGVWLGR